MRGDALHRDAEGQDPEGEPGSAEHHPEPKPTAKVFVRPQSEHLQPLAENGNGHKHANGNAHGHKESGPAVLAVRTGRLANRS